MIEKHYTAKETIKILGNISMSTLQRIQNDGEIVPNWAANKRMFPESAIKAYLERKKQ